MKPDQFFVTFFMTMLMGAFLTAVTWPYLLPIYALVVFAWLVIGYFHAEAVWKKWYEEYTQNK